MADRDVRTLNVVHEASRTADRLARRMGGEYVLHDRWRTALNEQGPHKPQSSATR